MSFSGDNSLYFDEYPNNYTANIYTTTIQTQEKYNNNLPIHIVTISLFILFICFICCLACKGEESQIYIEHGDEDEDSVNYYDSV